MFIELLMVHISKCTERDIKFCTSFYISVLNLHAYEFIVVRNMMLYSQTFFFDYHLYIKSIENGKYSLNIPLKEKKSEHFSNILQ